MLFEEAVDEARPDRDPAREAVTPLAARDVVLTGPQSTHRYVWSSIRDGLDEVRPRQEWSPCRRLDTLHGRWFKSTRDLLPPDIRVEAMRAQMALIK